MLKLILVAIAFSLIFLGYYQNTSNSYNKKLKLYFDDLNILTRLQYFSYSFLLAVISVFAYPFFVSPAYSDPNNHFFGVIFIFYSWIMIYVGFLFMKQRIKDINPDYNTNTLFQWRRIVFFGPSLLILFSLLLDFIGTVNNIRMLKDFFEILNLFAMFFFVLLQIYLIFKKRIDISKINNIDLGKS